MSELQVQKVPLNTLSKLETCRSPTCTGIGTQEHMLEIKIQCLLTVPSSETAYKDLYNMVYVTKALRLFQLFLRHAFPRRNKHCQVVLPKPKNGNHFTKMPDFSHIPSTVTGVVLNCGYKVSLHSASKRMQVVNPRCTHVSKVMIIRLSAFTLHVELSVK